jgi:hypothetical protein
MGLTNFKNGITSFGVPQILGADGRTGAGAMFGVNRFVDSTNGQDSVGFGGSPDKAYNSLTYAFSELTARTTSDGIIASKNATIFVAPGDYSGNYSSPLNADAAFVSLIGVQATDVGFGPWAAASTTTSPILAMRARGWRISGFEFDGATSEASVKLTTSGTSNSNFTQIDHCLFTGGKYGIDWVGAPTYTKILNCIFEDILTSAFTCTNSATDVPRRCDIIGNRFGENAKHMDMNSAGATRGFKASRIQGNSFQLDGIDRDATVLLDNRGGGGTAIIGNYFDCTKTQYGDDSATAFIRTAASDWGAGNSCYDGVPAADISD